MLGWFGPAFAGQVTNPASGQTHATLSAAIAAATPGDTLEIANGEYFEAVVIDRDLTLIGEVSSTGDVLIAGPVGPVNVVTVLAGVSTTLENITVLGSLNDYEQRPMRIRSGAGDITLRSTALVALAPLAPGAAGGALWAEDFGTLTLEDAVISGATDGQGGAIRATSVNGSLLVVDRVTVEAARVGGWVDALSLDNVDLVLTDSVLRAVEGEAIDATNASLTVTRTTFCNVDRAVLAMGPDEVHRLTNSVFVSDEDLDQLVITEGTWTIANNAFLGTSGIWTNLAAVTVVNNVFASAASGIDPVSPLTPTWNWFHDVGSELPLPADPSNYLGAGDPLFQAWSADADCENDVVVPSPIVSPLIDAGDPAISDPDGSRSDLGPAGGPDADPVYHVDSDLDGLSYLYDCDDDDPLWSSAATWFADCDLDGHGDPTTSLVACTPPADCAWVTAADDCDDLDSARFMGAADPCGDAVDQDCDGADGVSTDRVAWFPDGDGDGYGDGAAEAVVDCAPIEGRVQDPSDCDDADPEVHPGATERCDGLDQDCDEQVDDGAPTTWYADHDGDGAGDPDMAVYKACPPSADWIGVAGDCDDFNPERIEGCADKDGPAQAGCACASGSAPSGWSWAPGWLALLALGARRRP